MSSRASADGLAVDRRDHVAGLEPGLRGGRVGLDAGHQHAVLRAEVLGELRRQLLDAYAEPPATGREPHEVRRGRRLRWPRVEEELRASTAPAMSSRRRRHPANMSGEGTLNSNSRSSGGRRRPLSGVTERSTRLPSRSTAVFTVRPSGVSADQPRQVPRAPDVLAVEIRDDVALLDPGLRRGAVRAHLLDQRAAGGRLPASRPGPGSRRPARRRARPGLPGAGPSAPRRRSARRRPPRRPVVGPRDDLLPRLLTRASGPIRRPPR